MDNRSERPSSRGKPSLEEKIYRAPVINVVSMFSCLAVALVLLLAIIFFILGGSFLTDHGEDGTLYRYVGLMRGDVPYFGVFKGTDGTGGRISGDKVKFNDGSVYEGELRFLKFHGKGCFTDTYGNMFEGVYENGLLTGEGTVSYADGSSFNGNFSGGLFEGYGEITHADGSSYRGFYSAGEKSGYGELTYTDGSVYKGDFLRDMRHGNGEYRFSSGDVYTGEFKNNLMSGLGSYFFSSGRVYRGRFVAGVPMIG